MFSQWSSMLDIMEYQLREVGVTHLRLDGDVKGKARSAVLRQFEKGDYSVLLINIFAGGVGTCVPVLDRIYGVGLYFYETMCACQASICSLLAKCSCLTLGGIRLLVCKLICVISNCA